MTVTYTRYRRVLGIRILVWQHTITYFQNGA